MSSCFIQGEPAWARCVLGNEGGLGREREADLAGVRAGRRRRFTRYR